jgi:cell division protein FtsQ
VEPKLRARRIEVARDQGRRRLRRAVAVLAVVAVVAIGFGLTQSPLLDVDQVEVRGAEATGAAAVREAAAVDPGTPLVSVDTGAVTADVEALPWIERASVTRGWPGTLRIEVVERVPVAIVGSGSRAVLVDADGWAVGPAAQAPEQLPVVSGAPVALGSAVADEQREAVAVLDVLPASIAAEVAEIDVSSTGVVLTLDDDIEVLWGDASQADAKAEALEVLLEQADRPTIATIDLTVPRAATLTRKNGGS